MRLKLDENLPERLRATLSELGHDTDTVVSEGLAGRDDEGVWRATQEAGRFLITKDLGFSDIRSFPPGQHRGILVLRLSDDRSVAAADRLGSVFAGESVEDWTGCLVVVSDHKVRIRRPAAKPRKNV